MKFMCLSLLLFCTSTFAAVCDVQDQPDERLLSPHKSIETIEGTLLVIGLPPVSEQLRADTRRLLTSQDAGPGLENDMKALAAKEKGYLDRIGNLRDYLLFGLTEKTYAFIMRDQTPETFMREQQEATDLYNDDFTQGVRSGVTLEAREPLLLMNMGALAYLRMQHPDLFQGVTISVFDTTPVFAAPAAAAPAAEHSKKSADEIAAEFRRKFAKNPKTVGTFNKFVSTFNPRGLSAARMKIVAQRLVMSQAKPLMGQWVEAKMAGPVATAPAARAGEEVRKKEFDLGQALLTSKGAGAYLVDESSVTAVVEALVNACKRQP